MCVGGSGTGSAFPGGQGQIHQGLAHSRCPTRVAGNMFSVQDAESDDVVILLLGNKTDREEDRQVSTEAGQQLAQVSSWASAPPPA